MTGTNGLSPEKSEELKVYSVRISNRARRRIAEATANLAGWSGDRARAERWSAEFLRQIGSLATLPHRYQVFAHESRLLKREVRRLLFSNALFPSTIYHALYEIIEDGEDGAHVTVVHVRYAAGRRMTRREADDVLADQ